MRDGVVQEDVVEDDKPWGAAGGLPDRGVVLRVIADVVEDRAFAQLWGEGARIEAAHLGLMLQAVGPALLCRPERDIGAGAEGGKQTAGKVGDIGVGVR